mmetsp:Transcript_58047/g.141877  ORF Transcript_58047/g.141877 Transcript_58047/m.141877 type:complete len:88 (-) Transcript_58047:2589-2852(-)
MSYLSPLDQNPRTSRSIDLGSPPTGHYDLHHLGYHAYSHLPSNWCVITSSDFISTIDNSQKQKKRRSSNHRLDQKTKPNQTVNKQLF